MDNRRNYTTKPILLICKNCKHLAFDSRPKNYGKSSSHKENVRCGLDSLPVLMTASCNEFHLS